METPLAIEHEDRPELRHHFADEEQQRNAASLGMWWFLGTEIMFFGGMFCGYLVYRRIYYPEFAAASRTIALFWGTLNTAVLICSSLTVAMSVRAAQACHVQTSDGQAQRRCRNPTAAGTPKRETGAREPRANQRRTGPGRKRLKRLRSGETRGSERLAPGSSPATPAGFARCSRQSAGSRSAAGHGPSLALVADWSRRGGADGGCNPEEGW